MTAQWSHCVLRAQGLVQATAQGSSALWSWQLGPLHIAKVLVSLCLFPHNKSHTAG
jgi:hypothetical protein